MAGGLSPGRGRSMRDRVRVSRPAGSDAEPLPATARRQGPTHCWVQDPPEAVGRWPGLLLGWSRSPTGEWRGQVAYAFLWGSEVVLVQAWLAGDLLRRR